EAHGREIIAILPALCLPLVGFGPVRAETETRRTVLDPDVSVRTPLHAPGVLDVKRLAVVIPAGDHDFVVDLPCHDTTKANENARVVNVPVVFEFLRGKNRSSNGPMIVDGLLELSRGGDVCGWSPVARDSTDVVPAENMMRVGNGLAHQVLASD